MIMSLAKIPKTCNGCRAYDDFAGGCQLDFDELNEPCPKPKTIREYVRLAMVKNKAMNEGKTLKEAKQILLEA